MILLTQLFQRHAELEQAVGCLASSGVAFIAGQKSLGRRLVVRLCIVGFAQPVLRVSGKLVLPVPADECAKAGLRLAKPLAQEVFI